MDRQFYTAEGPELSYCAVYGIGDVKVYSPLDPLCLPLCLGVAGGQPVPVSIDDNKLYHIVVDLYALRMLGHVNAALSMFGLPSIYPRDAAGNPLDLTDGCLWEAFGLMRTGTRPSLRNG